MGEGNWYWKRDNEGSLMEVKEDGMKEGVRKGG